MIANTMIATKKSRTSSIKALNNIKIWEEALIFRQTFGIGGENEKKQIFKI